MTAPFEVVHIVTARPLEKGEPHRCAICNAFYPLGLVKGGVFRGGVVLCDACAPDLAAVIAEQVTRDLVDGRVEVDDISLR